MKKNDQKLDFDKALELLPWYAKNQLPAEDKLWVKNQLSQSPELQTELDIIQKQIGMTESYVESIDTKAYENKSERLNALKNRIKVQRNLDQIEKEKFESAESKVGEKIVQEKNHSILDKLFSFLPKTQKQWQVASAAALSVMVIQGVIIANLAKPKGVEYETLSGVNSPSTDIVLLAKFKRHATMGQMQLFLSKSNLRIVGGPDLENQYRLSLKQSVVRGKPLNDEEVSDLIFDLLDNQVVDFILREE